MISAVCGRAPPLMAPPPEPRDETQPPTNTQEGAATYLAEEIRTPDRALPRALVGGTLIVTSVYLAANVAFVYALPLEALKGVLAVGSAVARALWASRGSAIFSGMMAAALLSCVSAMSIAGPRVYYAMAQDGCFPRTAARLHPRRQTPVASI